MRVEDLYLASGGGGKRMCKTAIVYSAGPQGGFGMSKVDEEAREGLLDKTSYMADVSLRGEYK